MIAGLCWKGKRVLIVGRGAQGERKGAQLEKDGALVDYVDTGFEWQQLDPYDFVYASTDDENVNGQIVDYANAHGLWCASASYNEKASVHFMRSLDLGQLEIGFSTKHGFLMYGQIIEADLEKLYESKWKEKLEVLRLLRPAVKGHKEIMDYLMELSTDRLRTLADFNDKKFGVVCVFHSCRDEDQYEKMHDFCGKDTLVVFMDEPLTRLMEFFSLCGIKVRIVPMLVSKGSVYHKLSAIMERFGYELDGILLNGHNWKALLRDIDRPDSVFVVHTSRDQALKKEIASYCRNAQVVEYNEAIDWNEGMMRIYPLFMNAGKHVLVDVAKQVDNGRAHGCTVSMPFSCLLDMEKFKEIFNANLSFKNI